MNICYDGGDQSSIGNETYIAMNQAPLNSNTAGYGTYAWDTSRHDAGNVTTWAGYLWSSGKPYFSHLTTPIKLVAAPALTAGAQALTVEASAPPTGVASSLTAAELQPILSEAEQRLTAATGIQVAAAMTGVSVQIASLPDKMLGEEAGNTHLPQLVPPPATAGSSIPLPPTTVNSAIRLALTPWPPLRELSPPTTLTC